MEKATIRWAKSCFILITGIQAIKMALNYVSSRKGSDRKHMIAIDRQEALQAMMKGNATKRGREALQSIFWALEQVNNF